MTDFTAGTAAGTNRVNLQFGERSLNHMSIGDRHSTSHPQFVPGEINPVSKASGSQAVTTGALGVTGDARRVAASHAPSANWSRSTLT